MTQYDKLVRDKIPEIIRENGGTCKTHNVSGDDLFKYLDRKLDEEVSEFHKDRNIEELADIFEVLIGLANNLGFSEKELLECRNEKLRKRGGFEKGIVLEES